MIMLLIHVKIILPSNNLETKLNERLTFNLIKYFRYRRATHVTPKSYLSFINGYKEIYSQKFTEIKNLANRMDSGLHKLSDAAIVVAELKNQLALKEKDLIIASQNADKVKFNALQTIKHSR